MCVCVGGGGGGGGMERRKTQLHIVLTPRLQWLQSRSTYSDHSVLLPGLSLRYAASWSQARSWQQNSSDDPGSRTLAMKRGKERVAIYTYGADRAMTSGARSFTVHRGRKS